MFILDFDDTLFDTQKFKSDRQKALEDIGVSPDLYHRTYLEAGKDSSGRFIYNDENHARVLSGYGYSEKQIWQTLKAVSDQVFKYLFVDANDFVLELRKIGQPLWLLSLGEKKFQENVKISPLPIASLFDRIIVTDLPKTQILIQLLQGMGNERIFFINDKPSEAREVNNIFPNLRQILKVSPLYPVASYEETGFPFFNTLTEIKQYVRNQLE